jgi:hypothetical protein
MSHWSLPVLCWVGPNTGLNGVLDSGTSERDLVWRWVLGNAIKLRRDQMRMHLPEGGSLFSVTGVLRRRGKFGHRHRGGEGGGGDGRDVPINGGVPRIASCHQRLEEAGKNWTIDLQRECGPADTLIWDLCLQRVRKHILLFKPPNLWSFVSFGSFRTHTQPPFSLYKLHLWQ